MAGLVILLATCQCGVGEITGNATEDSSGERADADSSPSPDANADAGVAIEPELISFSPRRGLYDAEFELSISSGIPHDEIRYTTDGTRPSTTNGSAYTGPILISATATVRATVIVAGTEFSRAITHTYIFPAQVIRQGDERPDGDYVFWTTEMDATVVDDPAYSGMIEDALRSIPTMSIVTDPELMFGEAGIHRGNNLMEGSGGQAGDPPHPDWVEEVETSLEMFYPDDYPRGPYAGFQVDCGIKAQGGGGRWYMGTYDHKQSFGLRFRSDYGSPSLKYPLFEDAPLHSDGEASKYDKLILRSGHNKSWGATWDNAKSVYTRDQLGRDLQIDASNIGARGTFVHLYINGLYWGLYNVTERPDDAHSANYLGGEEADWYAGKAKGGDVDGDNSRFDHWRYTVSTSGDFDTLREYLAVEEYIDMCLLNIYAATGDFPQYYFGNNNNPAGLIYFYAWDTEDAFGGGSKRTSDTPQVDRMAGCYQFYEMWAGMAEFRALVADRAYRAVVAGGALTDDNVAASWDALNHYIEAAIVGESARWGDERIADTGERYTRDDQWRSARDLVSASIDGKAERLLEQLRNNSHSGVAFYPDIDPPAYSHDGGVVTAGFALALSNPNSSGTIWYRTDGQDPRAPGGGTATQAADYAGAITISQPIIVKARVKDGDSWSALAEAEFTIN